MITEKQMSALKYLIFKAKCVNDFTKKVIIILLENSQMLTKEIYVTLQEGVSFNQDTLLGLESIRALINENHNFHLNEILVASGGDFCFSFSYGSFDENGIFKEDGHFRDLNEKNKVPVRYTIWLGKKEHSQTAEMLVVSRREIDQVDLSSFNIYKEADIIIKPGWCN